MRRIFRNSFFVGAKNFSPLLFILLLYSSAFAGDLQTDIATVENFTASAQTLQLNFVQKTFVKVLGKNIEKKGTLSLKKGGKFRIEYLDKTEKLFVCDGEILWVVDPSNPEPQSLNAHGGAVPEEVFTMLSDGKSLQKDFQIAELQNAEGNISLKFQPRKKTSYNFLEGIFSKNGAPENLKIINSSGNVTEYQFSNLKKDQQLADTYFSLSSGKATPDTLPE